MAISSVPAPRKRSFIKRILPRSLFGRLVLIILSPLILLQVISTWVFYDRHYETVTRRLAQGLSGDIAAVIQMMIRNPGSVDRLQTFRLAERVMLLKLTFEEGARLEAMTRTDSFGILTSVLDRQLTKALQEIVDRPFLIDTNLLEKQVRIDVQLADGMLRVLAPRKRLFSSTTYIFIMWMFGSSIVLFVVALLFMRNQVKSIRRLAQAADSFGKGRDVADFKPEGATEVRQAAGAFIQMRNRIKRQIRQRTEILAGVSHDLRTPLTRMKLQLAMLGDGPEVTDLRSDVVDMEKMIDGYLAFARGEGDESAVDTDLAETMNEVVALARRDGTPVDVQAEGGITLPLRPNAFKRCLGNLVGNATRHGAHVWLRAAAHGELVEITIDDDGQGIPEPQRAEVFRPFYRIDQSRNPETGGVGLGLTIARDVIHRHGGEITLEDSPHGGLRVRLRLPT